MNGIHPDNNHNSVNFHFNDNDIQQISLEYNHSNESQQLNDSVEFPDDLIPPDNTLFRVNETNPSLDYVFFPSSWVNITEKARSTGIGPFTTKLFYKTPQTNSIFKWQSRSHRKQLTPSIKTTNTIASGNSSIKRRLCRLKLWVFKPYKYSYWTAFLFTIGSALFSFASTALFTGISYSIYINWLAFLGSILFTIGAICACLEVYFSPQVPLINHRLHPKVPMKPAWYDIHWFRRLDFYVVSIQMLGCILFDINTFAVVHIFTPLSTEQNAGLVFFPSIFASICFSVSSYLSIVEISHQWFKFTVYKISHWICWSALIGSLMFLLNGLLSVKYSEGLNSIYPYAIGSYLFLFSSYLAIIEQGKSLPKLRKIIHKHNRLRQVAKIISLYKKHNSSHEKLHSHINTNVNSNNTNHI